MKGSAEEIGQVQRHRQRYDQTDELLLGVLLHYYHRDVSYKANYHTELGQARPKPIHARNSLLKTFMS